MPGHIRLVALYISRYNKPKNITFVKALRKNEDGTLGREKVKVEQGTL